MNFSGMSSKRATLLAAVLALAVLGPMCGGGGGGGAPAGGGTSFQVLAHTPATSAVGVARTATIYLTVNGTTDPATLAGNITLQGNPNPIPATLSWNAVTSAIEILPTTPMDINAVHTVSITSGVKTTGGTAMTPKSFTFTTVNSADVTPPTFSGATAVTTPGTTTATVTWGAGNDPGGTPVGSLLYDVYVTTISGAHNFGNPPFATSAAGATSVALTGLAPNTTYFVVVRCRDASGNQDANTTQRSNKTLVSFLTNIYTPIVNNICTQCHTPGGVSQFMRLDLGSSDVVNNKWVNINSDTGMGPPQMCQTNVLKRVLPGDPANSLVYLKISQTTPPCGARMPEGLPPLSASQILLFFDWITQGANDN